MERRHEPEQQRAGGGQNREERKRRRIERRLRRARKVCGAKFLEQRDTDPRDSDTKRRGGARKQRAFGQQVADDPCARRAERGPHGQLAATAGDPRDEQIGRVRARHHPHERDGRESKPGGRRDVADDVPFQIDHAPRRAIVLVRRSPDWKEPSIDRSQLGAGSCAVAARAQTSQRDDEKRAFPRRGRPMRRNEEVLSLLERSDDRREHSGQRVIQPIESNALANGIRASTEPPPPEVVADHHHARTRVASVLDG